LISPYGLSKKTKNLIKDLPIVVFHHTSTGALDGIIRNGLVSGLHNVNRHDVKNSAGVYVTLRDSGKDVEGYLDRARHYHGGDDFTIQIKTSIDQLYPDPDDADLSCGVYQFVLPKVSCSDIVNFAEIKASVAPASRRSLKINKKPKLLQKELNLDF
jgi:hypothetical protein